jgi:hypothetical protein
MFALYRRNAERERLRTLLGASVANLKTTSTLALDDDLAALRAQFDLANVTASSIDLLRD